MNKITPPSQFKPLTYSESHGFPSILSFLLLPVGQHPLQQHLSQLFLPWVLSFYQSDGLGQRCPLSPHQPFVEFIQQSLLRSTQVLDLVLRKGRADHPGRWTAAVTRGGALAAGRGGEDPPLEAARLCHRGGGEDAEGCDVTMKGDAKWSHCCGDCGELGGETTHKSKSQSEPSSSCDEAEQPKSQKQQY